MTAAVNTFIMAQAAQSSNLNNQWLKNAQQTGWILAGSYYYAISDMTKNNITNSLPTLTANAIDPASDPNNVMNPSEIIFRQPIH